ncbi:MAG: ABC transporter permease [Acidimicrobiales bacterium]|nr:ABC transporter permease [Acidimicrobiales bacterium]
MTAAVSADGIPPLIEHGSVPRSLPQRLRDVWEYRELLGNLVRRELKVRYKESFLGFIWTLLNPLLYLLVFSFVFGFVLKGGPPRYGLLFLSGLLVWNLFSVGLGSATSSIIGNGALVQKVWFPREILPIAAVGASIISFFFQIVVLVIGLAVFRQVPAWSMLWMLIPALLATILLATGLGFILSAYNVYYRDTGHFLELALLSLFWFTPIVYQYDFVAGALRDWGGERAEWLTVLNPMIAPMVTFHRVLYNPSNLSPADQEAHFELLMRGQGFLITMLAISLLTSLVLCLVGIKVFARLEGDFGEAL